MSGSRLVEVPPERLERWVAGFRERHGGCDVEASPDVVRLSGPDGGRADLEVPFPPLSGPVSVASLAAHAAAPRTALLVLVRRGGYAAGLARDGVLVEHAVGTRYVQGRTAAGGWSQQRFARRRQGQTAALTGSAVGAVLRVLERGPRPDVVVPGGDRLLSADVLDDPLLEDVSGLPRGPLLDVPDPRLVVLQDAARRCRTVRIRLTP